MLSVIKVILIVAAVILTTANRTYAAHSGAECYLNGHRIYVPDGLNYPRQAWAGWGISCRTQKPVTSKDALRPPLNACVQRCGSRLTTPMPCSISRCYCSEQTNMPRRQITGVAISPAIVNRNGPHGRADH